MSLESTLAQTAEETFKLEAGGVVVMTVSILLVVSLTAFCLYRVLREKAPSGRRPVPPNGNPPQPPTVGPDGSG